jgi:hypothetical protein
MNPFLSEATSRVNSIMIGQISFGTFSGAKKTIFTQAVRQ